MAGNMTIRVDDESSGYSVVMEDNGRVAYAYLLNSDGKIVGDVWLFNRVDAPLEPEWTDPDKAPFANPADYAKEIGGHHAFECSDFDIVWGRMPNGAVKATINHEGFCHAILGEGTKPGWSILASKDGPLAKAM